MRSKVQVEVVEVRGHCPVHKVGDRFEIDVHKITRASINCEALCYHALSAIYGAYFMSRAEIAKEESFAQCFDPGPPYAPGGGTVIFKLTREAAE